MNLGWSLAVEKLLNYELPEKARHLRVIIAEMGRIASHLVGMGAYGLDLGTFSPFLYAFREREKILDLFEEACGARLTYSYLTRRRRDGRSAARLAAEVRGVSRPVRAGHPGVSHAAHDQRDLRQAHRQHRHAVARDGDRLRLHRPGAPRQRRRPRPAPRRRRRSTPRCTTATPSRSIVRDGTATIPKDHDYPAGAARGGARRLLAPVLRADARSRAGDRPGAAGDRPLQHGHGQLGRADQAHRRSCPRARPIWKPNAPRGQMGFYIVSDGDSIPWRVRARSSCFCNLSVTHELCRGCLIADVPAIVGSLDIVMGEIDR